MTRNNKAKILKFVRDNFWGIFYSSLGAISFLLILILGIGNFILLLLIVLAFFLIGNSKDKNKSILQTTKEYIDKVNTYIKNLKL